jgi:hypothetical protein
LSEQRPSCDVGFLGSVSGGSSLWTPASISLHAGDCPAVSVLLIFGTGETERDLS